jgi:hypothetical protein
MAINASVGTKQYLRNVLRETYEDHAEDLWGADVDGGDGNGTVVHVVETPDDDEFVDVIVDLSAHRIRDWPKGVARYYRSLNEQERRAVVLSVR